MVKKRVAKKAVRRSAGSRKASVPGRSRAVRPLTAKDLTDIMVEMEAWCCALREILLSVPPRTVMGMAKVSRGRLLWDGGVIPQIKGCPPPRLPQCRKPGLPRTAAKRR